MRALGSEYVGVRYRNRYASIEESPPWRIIGAVNGTLLKWDPAVPAGAPTTLSLGQVAQFNSNGPFVVSSQDSSHPFYVSAHMTGAEQFDPGYTNGMANGNTPDGRGDAEFVNVIPPDEYLNTYVFFTDPTYPETDLVFVRAKGPSGFDDVTLDCAGTLTGWQPVGTTGKYEYTRFDLVTGRLPGHRHLQQRPPPGDEQAALRRHRVGLGLRGDRTDGHGLLQPVCVLRIPGGRRRRPHQPGRHPPHGPVATRPWNRERQRAVPRHLVAS